LRAFLPDLAQRAHIEAACDVMPEVPTIRPGRNVGALRLPEAEALDNNMRNAKCADNGPAKRRLGSRAAGSAALLVILGGSAGRPMEGRGGDTRFAALPAANGRHKMAGSRRLGRALAVAAGALALTGTASAQVPEGAMLPTAEEHPTATLPEASPHWVYILEPVFPHLIVTKIWIVDGDSLNLLGMINGGYTANLGLAEGASELYMAETFWSRGSRGDRTDVVTTFDPARSTPRARSSCPKAASLWLPRSTMRRSPPMAATSCHSTWTRRPR
jgi:hypothetical protein